MKEVINFYFDIPLLHPLRWCCVDCVIHHLLSVIKRKSNTVHICGANKHQQSDHGMWTLLSLPATVRSYARMTLGISHRNKMVLRPGCEGRAEFTLHTKNVRSVRFIVNRRGCCCNLSGGVALIVWFTTNGMCVKNSTIHICGANKQQQSDHGMWTLLLLAATVRSFAHMPLGISDRITTNVFQRTVNLRDKNKFLELVDVMCCLIANLGCYLKNCKVFLFAWLFCFRYYMGLNLKVDSIVVCAGVYLSIYIQSRCTDPLFSQFSTACLVWYLVLSLLRKNFPITFFEAFVLLSYTLLGNTMVLLGVFQPS